MYVFVIVHWCIYICDFFKKKKKNSINENLGSWRIGQTFVSRQHSMSSMRGKKQHSITPLTIRGYVKVAQNIKNL